MYFTPGYFPPGYFPIGYFPLGSITPPTPTPFTALVAYTNRGDQTYGAWLSITPGTAMTDAAGNEITPRGILITGAGVVKLQDRFGNVVTTASVVANTFLSLQSPLVVGAGTTAILYGLF